MDGKIDESRKDNYFDLLPTEVLLEIFNHLEPQTILLLRCINSHWRSIISHLEDYLVWKRLYLNRWNIKAASLYGQQEIDLVGGTWQEAYLETNNNCLERALNNLELQHYKTGPEYYKLSFFSLGLPSLPSSIFADFSHIKSLDLSYNKLKRLPLQLFTSLTSLEVLKASNNIISSIPPEISRLQELQVLSLFANRLTTLPVEMSLLTNLFELLLSSNQLTSLPPQLKTLRNLRYLNAGHNRLSTVPHEYVHMQSLTELNVEDNNLTTFPLELVSLENLRSLNLSSNPRLKINTDWLKVPHKQLKVIL